MGRSIGYPTINLEVADSALECGVYPCEVEFGGKEYKGAMHFGPSKVTGKKDPSFEIHLLDFNGDLNEGEVNIKVYDKIRETMDFEDLESLKKQIGNDVKKIRNFFKKK